MSTAAAEKKDTKPAPSMGSFLSKLQPASPKKEKADEPAKTDGVAKAADVAAPAAGKAEVVESKADAKPEGKGQEDAGQTDLKDEKGKIEDRIEQLEKRLKDTHAWGNEEHKARLKAERMLVDLQKKLEIIDQKISGTHEEPPPPSPEQLVYNAEMRGKIRASHRAAVKKYGEEYVLKTVWADDSPYMQLQKSNHRIGERVMASDDPVQEALDILQEEEDAKKYGRTSEEMKKKIEAELRPKLEQEIAQKVLKTQPGPAASTLGNVRGESDRVAQKADAPQRLDLKAVFPWGASRT